MKLKCNVCNESPIVSINDKPKHESDLICCPSCDKQLAFAMPSFDWSKNTNFHKGLFWHPIDYCFDRHLKRIPVIILEK